MIKSLDDQGIVWESPTIENEKIIFLQEYKSSLDNDLAGGRLRRRSRYWRYCLRREVVKEEDLSEFAGLYIAAARQGCTVVPDRTPLSYYIAYGLDPITVASYSMSYGPETLPKGIGAEALRPLKKRLTDDRVLLRNTNGKVLPKFASFASAIR